MIYKSLTPVEKVLVPLVCASAFLYYFFKTKNSSMPKKIAYGNLIVCIGMLLAMVADIFRLFLYKRMLCLLDISIIVLFVGSSFLLKGGFEHVDVLEKSNKIDVYEAQKKRGALKGGIALLIIMILGYISLRLALV